jgi:hypothetical protein
MGLAATVVIVSMVSRAHGAAGEDARPDSRQGCQRYTSKHLLGRFSAGRLRRAAAWDTNGEGQVATYA